tara:strand:+ start:195 stop:434 length:240 start_codon:yes stop_codon:yes gene_type:complete
LSGGFLGGGFWSVGFWSGGFLSGGLFGERNRGDLLGKNVLLTATFEMAFLGKLARFVYIPIPSSAPPRAPVGRMQGEAW